MILGIGLGIEEVVSHGYLDIGFERSAYLALWDSVGPAAPIGLVAGLGWAGIVFATGRLGDKLALTAVGAAIAVSTRTAWCERPWAGRSTPACSPGRPRPG